MGRAAGSHTAAYSAKNDCAFDDIKIHRLDENTRLADKLAPLLRAARREGLEILLQPLLDAWNAGTSRFNRAGEALYCVEHQGRVVAVCGRLVDDTAPRTLRVRHAYVLPEYRGLGIARTVCRRYLEEIPRGLFDRLVLRAYFRPGRSMCGNFGFRRVDGPDFTHELALQ